MLKATDLMTPDPDCCTPDEPMSHALRIMDRDGCGMVPIVRDKKSLELVGVVTDRDLALSLYRKNRAPTDVSLARGMTADLITAAPEDTIDAILNRMSKHQIRRLPVVEPGDRLVGVISQADLVRHASGSPELEIKVEHAIERISAAPAAAGR